MATTNLGTLLLSELQSLSTEARRKHPDVKEAAERVIVILRGIKSTTSQQIASELAKSEEVIRPFVLACKTNNQRLTVAAVQCMQLLVSHQAISPGSIRESLNTLNSVLSYGVDTQVKILQMVLPLVTGYDGSVYGETLVEAFHLCIALQQSRDPVVSNTAAAILRQMVVTVFDRVVAEDRELNKKDGDNDKLDVSQRRNTSEQDMTRRYAKDAFFVLQDLCLLAADSDTIFIRDSSMDKGLVLELIESVLANHAHVVAQHTAMAQILRERLAPFFVNFFAEKALFTLVVRCIRIVWLFIRDLHQDMQPECEIFLSVLTRLVDPGGSGNSSNSSGGVSNKSTSGSRRASISGQRHAVVGMLSSKTVFGSGLPLFYRVLAMEVVRNILRDANLLHQLYLQYDGQLGASSDGSSEDREACHVVRDMVTAIGKVASEKPDIRTMNADGIPNAFADGQAAEFGASGSAASAGNFGAGSGGAPLPNAVAGKINAEALNVAKMSQIGLHNSSMRAEMRDLLDKNDPPNIPDTYMFYLALSAITDAVDGLAANVLSICSKNLTCLVAMTRTDAKSASHHVKKTVVNITEPALNAPLPKDERVRAVNGFAAQTWPVLLSAYAFFLGVRLDDALFDQVINTLQKLVQMCGALGIDEARNAILTLMCRNCLPQTAIADHEKQLQNGHGGKASSALASVSESVVEEKTDSPTKPSLHTQPLVTASLIGLSFTIHSRQVQCLRAIVASARYLASALGPMWYPVLVTMQQAEEVLYQSGGTQLSLHSGSGGSVAGSGAGSGSGSNPHGAGRNNNRRPSISSSLAPIVESSDDTLILSDIFKIHDEYAKLFAFVRANGDNAFAWVVRTLCLLGSDLSSVPVWHPLSQHAEQMRSVTGLLHRRISAAMNRPTFAVEELRNFAVSNVDILMGAGADAGLSDKVGQEAWSAIMYHLLATTTFVHTPAPIRTQACEALSDVVLAAMELVSRLDILPGSNEDDQEKKETAGADPPEVELSRSFAASVSTGDIQLRILTPLAQMMTGKVINTLYFAENDEHAESFEFGQFTEVRKLTLDTLHRVLQASGHSIKHAWSVVFDIIHSVLDDLVSPPTQVPSARKLSSSASSDSKQSGQLMRSVFPCLQLICTDYLEDLPADCLRRCIDSLTCFGRQKEDLNISLTAIGQAWALCDFFQAAQHRHAANDTKPQIDNMDTQLISSILAKHSTEPAGLLSSVDAALGPIIDSWWNEELADLQSHRTQQILWVLLLHSLSVLGRDLRHEVRLGAIQTLFRTLDMHGDSFDRWEWDSIIWAVVIPLAGYTLEQRAYVFELIQDKRLDELLSANAESQESKAQMASKSGVFVEDPALLYSKQWDETAATTLQGAAKAWGDQSVASGSGVWSIGYAIQAWDRMWHLVASFFVGQSLLAKGYLPCIPENVKLDVTSGYVPRLSDECGAEDSTTANVCAYLRTRSSVASAISCAATLISNMSGATFGVESDKDNDHSSTSKIAERWRISWLAWLSMCVLATNMPESASAAFNQDTQDRAVLTQDVLYSLLALCPEIVGELRIQHWFSEADCEALVTAAHRLVTYADAPLGASDATSMTKLQKQMLDTLLLVLDFSGGQGNVSGENPSRLIDADAAVAFVLSELTMLAVAPYSIQEPGNNMSGTTGGGLSGSENPAASAILSNSSVVKRAQAALSAYKQRVATIASLTNPASTSERKRQSGSGTKAKRTIQATFIALAEAALEKLGDILCAPSLFGVPEAKKQLEPGYNCNCAMRVLSRGIWRDVIVAMGWHLVVPLTATKSEQGKQQGKAADWFVRVVPSRMMQLRSMAAGLQSPGEMHEALADAWLAVGTVVGLTINMPTNTLSGMAAVATRAPDSSGTESEACGVERSSSAAQDTLPTSTQIAILDAVAEASLQYVAVANKETPARPAKQSEEICAYWGVLVGILEWGALMAAEPVVVLSVDESDEFLFTETGSSSDTTTGHTGFHRNRQALTIACFKWLFVMSSAHPIVLSSDAEQGTKEERELPLWVSEAAAPRLVRRIKTVLEAFVGNKALLGRSPMPQSHIELVRAILESLAQLQCQPGALNCLLTQSHESQTMGGGGRAAGQAFRQHALGGTTAHIFAMYDSLVNLLSVSDIAVLQSVQMCLHRVSAEIFK
ncbi:Endocytosis and vacuole integrity protein [Coemansia umbellata]|uniref:Endocytosis and vacuole integrity protein n=1 Tax=Coemansia umbellata TaxID=1424467 RepID=A0ABQ8PDG1_9FUNG|nr:Endocytosis and vacuole integrity protein [Coemansia umbellata]